MKKFVSAALALAMVLSVGSASFAYIHGQDAAGNDIKSSPVNGDAQYVYADYSSELRVNGNVTGKSGQFSVYAEYDGKIMVDGNVNESSDCNAVHASEGQVTVTGDVIESGDGNAIGAFCDGTLVKVNGNVEEADDGHAIRARENAQVEVNGNVKEADAGDAIYAIENAQVEVNGNVEEADDGAGAGNAIFAADNAQVKVIGNVEEADDGNAIYATKNAQVEVCGNVTGDGYDDGYGIYAGGAGTTVTVDGDVIGKHMSSGINAERGAKVTVSGNVEAEWNIPIVAWDDSTAVVVEGKVAGGIGVLSDGSGNIYLGQLDSDILMGFDNIHYLIGTGEGSQAKLSDITLESTVVDAGTIDGLLKTGYRYTTTADLAQLNGATITLSASGKKVTVEGLPAGVLMENIGGAAVLTLSENFKGGLQNLLLTLAKSGRKVVNIYVQIGGLTLPEGISAEDVKASDKVNCAGFTAAASLAGESSVQVFLDGSELNAKDYRVKTNADGSVSVVLNNDYLFALGNGTYDFTAKVGEIEIGFSVTVTK